jgi:hypothetical protein
MLKVSNLQLKRKIVRRSGEGGRADIYIEVKKRRGHIFF